MIMALRRAENVAIVHVPGWFSPRGIIRVHIGRYVYVLPKMHRDDFAGLQVDQVHWPQRLIGVGERTYWQFQHRFWWDNDGLTAAQVHALIVTQQQRERQRISRAEAMVAMGDEPRPTIRGAIPDDLKQYVWKRDGGRCRVCGSGVELQYDHVIPVAMGGGTSEQNLQILCGPCNRRKGAGLVV